MELIFTVFSHDSYVMELPAASQVGFYRELAYLNLAKNDYRDVQICQTPVIRLYGSTQAGEKACVHVHGYYPYLYIKAEQYATAFQEQASLRQFLELVEALFVQAYSPANKRIIFRGEMEQKYDFYGYHSSRQWFLKIYVYDPMNIHRLREMMSSKALNGKMFQCYEAHINYFMHFFADLNIYGLHQVTLMDFKFRRNIEGLQRQFAKLGSRFQGDTYAAPVGGIDLSDLSRSLPALFSPLEKLSSCYLEVDVHFSCILNYLYNLMMRTSEENSRLSINSEMVLEDIDAKKHEYFEVKITKALEQFWYDERERRTAHGINRETEVLLDYSKNIESDPDVIKGNRDPLWVNFLSKSDNFKLFKQGLQSYNAATTAQSQARMFIDKQLLQGYGELMQQNHERMVVSVQNRIKFYGVRSRRLIEQVIAGQKRELPEWDQKSISEGSASDQPPSEEEDNASQSVKSQDVLSYMMDSRSNVNTMALFRNNYKVQKGELKRQGYFRTCEYCKQISLRCDCRQPQTAAITNVNRFFEMTRPGAAVKRLRYSKLPPGVSENEESVAVQHQYPYYSSMEDYFRHHNIPQQFPRTRKLGQILANQVKTPKHIGDVVSIRNEQRLPQFWRDSLPHRPVQPPQPRWEKLRYLMVPPSKEQLQAAYQAEIPRGMEVEEVRPAAPKTDKNSPGVFSCDLTKITFELMTECSSAAASNAESDKLIGIVYSISNEKSAGVATGLVGLAKYFSSVDPSQCPKLNDLVLVKTEKDLLLFFALLVFKFDPDCLVSYDQEKKGLYYLVNRGAANGLNYSEMLGRAHLELDYIYDVVVFADFELLKSTFLRKESLVAYPLQPGRQKSPSEQSLRLLMARMEQKKKRKPVFRRKYLFNITVRGRVVLNLFRVYEFELKLKSYTLEAVARHLFGERMYELSDRSLYESVTKSASSCIEYQLQRILMMHRVIVRLNVLTAVIEKSKLYGCNFESMLERGSQFKIESIMYRVSRLNGYLLLSASKIQVAEQSVLECRPLVLQPPKQFYSDPVLVFDFQSLYPSVMIGYNLCYTTCLGSLKELFNPETRKKKFGVLKAANVDFDLLNEMFERLSEEESLKQLQKYIFVAPNKVAYVRKTVRQGIIPRILLQFLMSRIMIKESAKLYQDDRVKQLLNERQIAIKLFMNVMYGYTGASFSGRMPSSEIADSVVDLARYLLTTCIEDIDGNPKYGRGKVVYGDTDSIFYHLKGYSMQQAFSIGQQIARDMTKKFPYPVELKFEKVYDSLVLVAKKRYYGRCFEKFGGAPKYEGKGLECVRRDGIDLTCDLMRSTLNLLLDSKDLSKVKDLLLGVLSQSKAGLITEDKYCFAKEVKLLKYTQSSMPSHGHAARQLTNYDPNLIPKYGQRMKYLVTKGQNSRVKDNVVPMYTYKGQPLNYEYYHDRMVLPALQRTFTSLANLTQWLADMPVVYNPLNKHHFAVNLCRVCFSPNKDSVICDGCISKLDSTISRLSNEQDEATLTCMLCAGDVWISPPMGVTSIQRCVQWNCPNLYRRRLVKRRYNVLMPDLLKLRSALSEFSK